MAIAQVSGPRGRRGILAVPHIQSSRVVQHTMLSLAGAVTVPPHTQQTIDLTDAEVLVIAKYAHS